MKIKEIMVKKYPYIVLPNSRENALEIMRKNKVDFLPVIDENTYTLKGILTLKSFFEKPDETQVALLVQKNIVTIDEESEVKDSIQKMLKNKVRYIIVTKDNRYKGVLLLKHIISRVIARMNIKESIKNVYRNSVFTIWDQTPLFVAFKIMELAKTYVLIAINNKLTPSGILTLEDIARYCEMIKSETKSLLSAPSETEEWEWNVQTIVYIAKNQFTIPKDKKVYDAMSKKIIPVNKYISISGCAKIMARYNYSQLPVLDVEGNLIGIIFDEDLLKASLNYL